RPVLDFYAAVDPAWRRQSLGRALCEQAVQGASEGVFSLRARVRETGPGIAFLRSLGFVEKGAQLQLAWAPRDPLPEVVMPALRRMGIGRALVVRALKDAGGAVLSVAESNKAARALYRSLGFAQTSRRLLFALDAGSLVEP